MSDHDDGRDPEGGPLVMIPDKRCMTVAITSPDRPGKLQVFQEGQTSWICGGLEAFRALLVEVQDCVRILETGEVHPDPSPPTGGDHGSN